MSVEMTTESKTAQRVECPSCGKKARRLSPVTLAALLKDEFAGPFAADGRSCCNSNGDGCKPVTGDTGWRFCDSPECDVVYFSEEGDTTFTKSQLKVPVGVKETSGERPLCYCFGHSVASIKEELRTKGRSDALEDIRVKMNNPGCRCETENPSGACCLGSVAKGIQIAEKELGMSNTDVKAPPTPSRPSTSRGEKIAKVGTVLSAIVASSCCWLPLLLLAVGASGVGIAATMEAYRPVFIVVTFGFLAAAFYFTYRPRKAAHACCGPEAMDANGDTAECCAPSGKRGFSMMAMNKIMLWVVTVLAVAFLMFPHYVGFLFGTAEGDGTTGTAQMNQGVVKVEGMTCEGCAATVAQAIRSVPGVLAVKVSYEKGEAIVGTESCCPVPKEQILAALRRAGYRGEFEQATRQRDQLLDPAHEIVFRVGALQCPLVQGVGCGHRLAPTLARLEGIEGVAGSFSNWTGTLIRLSVAEAADRDNVAERVRAALAADQQSPVQLTGDELTLTLRNEEWRGMERIGELTSYEFSTVARRTIDTFADDEQLSVAQRERLLRLVDELWERTGADLPKPGPDGYSDYWQRRNAAFMAAYLQRARDLLTTEQADELARLASQFE